MQTAGGLVHHAVKLTAGVQRSEYDSRCGNTLFVHTHRDTSTVVLHGSSVT